MVNNTICLRSIFEEAHLGLSIYAYFIFCDSADGHPSHDTANAKLTVNPSFDRSSTTMATPTQTSAQAL
jgi:hypothetical protein